MKYYTIADLHGRFDLLEQAMLSIEHHANGEHTIITLGDYIDRGPQSKEIINKLMELQAKGFPQKDRLICLQGNHESMAVETITRKLNHSWWLSNGGDRTLESYNSRWPYSIGFVPEEHVKWMASLPLYFETEKHVFVHAGISDNTPLAEQQHHVRSDGATIFQWMLYGSSDYGGWNGKHVVHGHHQFADGPHTFHSGNGGRTNLDTFAWKTGRLVVGVFDDTQLAPVDFIEVTVG